MSPEALRADAAETAMPLSSLRAADLITATAATTIPRTPSAALGATDSHSGAG